jgi:hypothetical protein
MPAAAAQGMIWGRMAASRSSLSCLIVSMVLKYYVFGEQNYKTNPNRKHICRLFFTFAPR